MYSQSFKAARFRKMEDNNRKRGEGAAMKKRKNY